jgi:hypothetical protein
MALGKRGRGRPRQITASRYYPILPAPVTFRDDGLDPWAVPGAGHALTTPLFNAAEAPFTVPTPVVLLLNHNIAERHRRDTKLYI